MLGVLAQNVGAGKERDQGRGESIKRGGNRVVLINRVFFNSLVWPGYAHRTPLQTISEQRLSNQEIGFLFSRKYNAQDNSAFNISSGLRRYKVFLCGFFKRHIKFLKCCFLHSYHGRMVTVLCKDVSLN